ncbi:hypothetical protein [Pseudoalteromonas sp. MTN2-4]|uniref:hypothetical protein n=1 Tax=Pseudoalteromonas sp. MTN2-4 TaxID=3056555 RepID=UPI0036F229C8
MRSWLSLILIFIFLTVGYYSRLLIQPSVSSSALKVTSEPESINAKATKSIIADKLPQQDVSNHAINDLHVSSGQLETVIPVRWKQTGQLKAHFSRLKNMADQGDIDAKYILAKNLRYCFFAPIDDFALQAKLETQASYSDASEAIDNTLAQFDYCEAINQDQRRQFYFYLEDAAKQGSVAAQQMFTGLTAKFYMHSQGLEDLPRDEFIQLRDKFNQQKVSYLEQASKHGSEKALIKLSDLYRSQQIGDNNLSLVKSYTLDRLIMEITNNNELYNRYAWFEQRQYSQLSEEEVIEANSMFDDWLAEIHKNGTLYPNEQ